jgi:hypothetical protein
MNGTPPRLITDVRDIDVSELGARIKVDESRREIQEANKR